LGLAFKPIKGQIENFLMWIVIITDVKSGNWIPFSRLKLSF